MTLDDVYGSEHDRFPLEQERAPVVRALDWSDMIEWYGIANGARRPAGPQAATLPDAAAARSPVAVLLQAPR
ncbi:MAG: hypothetical protein WCE38_14825, partial [Burkholderiales bacterium]